MQCISPVGIVIGCRHSSSSDAAVSIVYFISDGGNCKRESFATIPANALGLHLTADKLKYITMTMALDLTRLADLYVVDTQSVCTAKADYP